MNAEHLLEEIKRTRHLTDDNTPVVVGDNELEIDRVSVDTNGVRKIILHVESKRFEDLEEKNGELEEDMEEIREAAKALISEFAGYSMDDEQREAYDALKELAE